MRGGGGGGGADRNLCVRQTRPMSAGEERPSGRSVISLHCVFPGFPPSAPDAPPLPGYHHATAQLSTPIRLL